MVNIEDIVQYIIDELSERDLPPLKTALVKLVYLADVESLRAGLPRITNVHWILYKYGPYAFELEKTIECVAGRTVDDLARVSLSGKSYHTYRSAGHGAEFKLSPQQRGIVNIVLDRWAGEDLRRLLNYVYFETEPMLEAQWGQPLDLGLVHPRTEPKSLADVLSSSTSPDRIRELARLKQAFWEKSHTRYARRVRPDPEPRYDDVLSDGLRLADEIGSTSQ
jgi:hypothetical protein